VPCTLLSNATTFMMTPKKVNFRSRPNGKPSIIARKA